MTAPDPDPVPAPTPQTAKALYKEGLGFYVSGDVSSAITSFTQARAKDPGYAPTYRGLGLAYEKKGDRAKAKKAFETYLKLAPDASDAASIRDHLEKLR